MALEDEDSTQDEVTTLCEELESAFHELQEEFRKVCVKNNVLKKSVASLSSNVEELKKEKIVLKNDFDTISNEKTTLKNNIDDLTKALKNFVRDRDNLNMLLENQKCVFDKAGIGYDDPIKKQKNLNTISEKAPLMTHPYITCHYCRKKAIIYLIVH